MSLLSEVDSVVDVITLNHVQTVCQIPSHIPVALVHLSVHIKFSRVVRELLKCGPSCLLPYVYLVVALSRRSIKTGLLVQVDVLKTIHPLIRSHSMAFNSDFFFFPLVDKIVDLLFLQPY